MIKIILFSVVIFGSLCLGTNTLRAHNTPLHDEVFQARLVGEIVDPSYVGIPDQLLESRWLPGEIILSDGQVRAVEALHYNGFHDELVFISESEQLIKLEKMRIAGFILENELMNETLVFEKIKLPSDVTRNSTGVYAQVLYDGELTLYAYRKIDNAGREIVREDNIAYERVIYKPATIYYLKLQGGELLAFNSIRRNTLQRLFPEQSDEIRRLMRSNNIQLRNDELELIRAIKVLETLLVTANQ